MSCRIHLLLGVLALLTVPAIETFAQQQPPIAIPDSKTVATATESVRHAYAGFYSTARTPVAIDELARKLLRHADSVKLPAERYASLEEARRVAVSGGCFATAYRATRSLSQQFVTDAWSLWPETIQGIPRKLRHTEQFFHFVELTRPIYAAALLNRRVEAAEKIFSALSLQQASLGTLHSSPRPADFDRSYEKSVESPRSLKRPLINSRQSRTIQPSRP